MAVPIETAGGRHVLWDWNGTLLDDLWLAVRSANMLLVRRGLPAITREDYLASFGFPVRSYYAALGFDFDRESFEDLSEEYVALYEADVGQCRLQPGAVETIDRLSSLGFTQSVLSASHLGFLDDVLRRFGIRDRFQDLAGLGDKLAHGKTEAGRSLLRRLGADPALTVLVGDTLHDFEVAADLGCRCMLFSGGHQARSRLLATGAPVVDRVPDLLPWIEKT